MPVFDASLHAYLKNPREVPKLKEWNMCIMVCQRARGSYQASIPLLTSCDFEGSITTPSVLVLC
jgi:hypothetical protein